MRSNVTKKNRQIITDITNITYIPVHSDINIIINHKLSRNCGL